MSYIDEKFKRLEKLVVSKQGEPEAEFMEKQMEEIILGERPTNYISKLIMKRN